ncbi:hypothetical protein [Candidatus Nitrosocosmicus arcticus]|uniref:Uncharacterized protein n=1 Tax=Candidatus Nitrosocosmicus arcticus TaxID=2035267 RepID=A0A557SXB3_9ARCH|nr:hypothetical protein [Candidatus Nitrosocosmicus arcticus]TVP41248.1 hypothetical protein NARC_40211 [Candidatus Nitrosocosmicus arcticus]
MLQVRTDNVNYPIRNIIFEKIKQLGTTTDQDLLNSVSKDGVSVLEDEFNKVLLDLEIYGLIRVSWLTKDKKRIELTE